LALLLQKLLLLASFGVFLSGCISVSGEGSPVTLEFNLNISTDLEVSKDE
jgi:hypothetical protein